MKKKFIEDKMRKVQEAYDARQKILSEEHQKKKLEKMIESANSTNDMSGAEDSDTLEPPEISGKVTKDQLRELIKAALGDAATDNIIE